MSKNPDYVPRQEPAEWTVGGKVAHFDRIEWRVIPDSATAAAALQAGEVDWYEQVQADLVPLLRRNPDIAIGSANPTGFNGILRFNHLHPPFNNVAVRRAVLMASQSARLHGRDHRGRQHCYAAARRCCRAAHRMAARSVRRQCQGDLDKARRRFRRRATTARRW